MIYSLFTILLAATVFSSAGCSHLTGDLTRDQSAQMINGSQHFSPLNPRFSISGDQVSCGIQLGIWVKRLPTPVESMLGSYPHYALTAQGRRMFDEISLSLSQGFAQQVRMLTKYQRRVVEITGISDYEPPLAGWKGKEVQFTYRWDSAAFPDVSKRCLAPERLLRATAIMRRYDDGWRVEDVTEGPF
jgi:hypothetical protein